MKWLVFQNIVPKVEPVDSPLTDYSGDNTNDTDIAVLDDTLEKKYSVSTENISNKSVCTTATDRCVKKWINEVSSTQPCLNVINEKHIEQDDEKEIEIDKEVETVLQSGTIVESLSITTDNLNFVSSEVQSIKGILYINSVFCLCCYYSVTMSHNEVFYGPKLCLFPSKKSKWKKKLLTKLLLNLTQKLHVRSHLNYQGTTW